MDLTFNPVNSLLIGALAFVVCLVAEYWLAKRRQKYLVPLEYIGAAYRPKTYRLGQIVKGHEVVRIEKVADNYYRVWGRPIVTGVFERGRRR